MTEITIEVCETGARFICWLPTSEVDYFLSREGFRLDSEGGLPDESEWELAEGETTLLFVRVRPALSAEEALKTAKRSAGVTAHSQRAA